MGIKYFFKWFKNSTPESITGIKRYSNDKTYSQTFDVLLIDLNGIIHTSAQKVYGYGNVKNAHVYAIKDNKTVFNLVCKEINSLVTQFCNKEVVICIDGVAPYSKQIQQRQRRFLSSIDEEETYPGGAMKEKIFDSNCISPGTIFMSELGKYIHFFILKKQSQCQKWKNLKVIFSNDKVSGEGEHKLLNYIRLYGSKDKTYCFYGNDADLIMLSISAYITCNVKNVFILREEYQKVDFLLIDIEVFISFLCKKFNSKNIEYVVVNFLIICFMLGNDFLPNIPCFEIVTNGLDLMIEELITLKISLYKTNLLELSRLVVYFINYPSILLFFKTLEKHYERLFIERLNDGNIICDDTLQECKRVGDSYSLDFDKYKELYHLKHFKDEQTASLELDSYFYGLQWVLTYYTKNTPCWDWSYNSKNTPLLSSMINHLEFETVFSRNSIKKSLDPFHQLLCILPPKSSNLLPNPLNNLLQNELLEYSPKELKLDYEGKRNYWEGTLNLPLLDKNKVSKLYRDNIKKVEECNLQNNIKGKNISYVQGNVSFINF